MNHRALAPAAFCLLLTTLALPQTKIGHSVHGSAFDSGLRSRPWKMGGLGPAPFKITTKNPEVQKWFNQGNALLHNFWWEEAERSFRWCLKLDPENPMVYWALAYSGYNWFAASADGSPPRYQEFLKQAVKFKHRASPRERMYIETWAKAYAPGVTDAHQQVVKGMQEVVLQYPDDIEAKVLLAFYNIGEGSAFANQLIIDEVLRKNPRHPGAHHASIHNWDGVNPAQALRSCVGYAKVAPGSGHALHMPGHIYTKIGKWHEAAWAMDSATRFELRYMNERLALPFETWNFSHNRNYLCYIQEQLGMEQAARAGAQDLLNAPRDPQFNPEEGAYFFEGTGALIRGMVKFERWDLIVKPGEIVWPKSEFAASMRYGTEALAYAAIGNVEAAKEKLKAMRGEDKKSEPDKEDEVTSEQSDQEKAGQLEVEGRIKFAEGDFDGGMKLLRDAAKIEDAGLFGGDPPFAPYSIWRVIGDAYRVIGDHKLAVDAYERALKKEPMDGFVLSGLAVSSKANGDLEGAKNYARQFLGVWSSPDPGLKWTKMVEDLNLGVKAPRNPRAYQPSKLDRMGPSNWAPFPAPDLNVVDAHGKQVSLADYRGKNVLLVFYLSDQCAHCMEQLKKISDKRAEFDQANTVVLAVCNAVESTAPIDGIRLLRDKDHVNARRFASYDDFENIELHSTILIDPQGRVRWKRTGGDPFTNLDFLFKAIGKLMSAKPPQK
jgi:peroxiredoxin